MRGRAAGVGMAGDELQATRVAAMRERDLQLGGRPERRRDAGHHLDGNAGGAAAPRSPRAARPNTIGSPPLRRTTRLPACASFEHQRVDVVLPAAGAAAGLADQHAPRLAPRQLQHLRAHQAVVEDDVGRLQRAQRLQRQQLGIAGAGADQGDRAAGCDGAARAIRSQQIALASAPRGARSAASAKRAPQLAARAAPSAGAPLMRARRRCAAAAQAPSAGCSSASILRADGLAEHRRGAVGADADHHRRAVDDGAEAESRRARGVSTMLTGTPCAPRGGGERVRSVVAIERADGERRAGEVIRRTTRGW